MRFTTTIDKLNVVNGPGSTEVATAAINLMDSYMRLGRWSAVVWIHFTVQDPQNPGQTVTKRLKCRQIGVSTTKFFYAFRGELEGQPVIVHYAFHKRSMKICGEIVDDPEPLSESISYARLVPKSDSERLNEECAILMSHDDIGNKMG